MITDKIRFLRRKDRVRAKIRSVSRNLPRLTVCKSNTHLHVQIIDDQKSQTVVAVSTQQKEFAKMKSKNNCDAALKVGNAIAKKAASAGVKKVVFDKGGYRFHGVIKNLADGAREAGLEI